MFFILNVHKCNLMERYITPFIFLSQAIFFLLKHYKNIYTNINYLIIFSVAIIFH